MGEIATTAVRLSETEARARIADDPRFAALQIDAQRDVYFQIPGGDIHRAYEVEVTGSTDDATPVHDRVYIAADDGRVLGVLPQIHPGRERYTHDAQSGTTLPGVLHMIEQSRTSPDAILATLHANLGTTYEAFHGFFGRDSYDGAGHPIIATGHYSTGYCNAYWGKGQFVFGDGAGTTCPPLGNHLDIVGHEFAHAVVESDSQLQYAGEAAGINESLADVFGMFVDAWARGGGTGELSVDSDWKIIEDAIPTAARSLCDPASDGSSRDLWTSTLGAAVPHYASGVGNLAFCLLAKGGTHPRGKTLIPVTGIGFERAVRIVYKAQADYLTSTASFADYREAMELAAGDLYDADVVQSVGCAFAAVKVGAAPAACAVATPVDPAELKNGVARTSLSGSFGSEQLFRIEVPAGASTLSIKLTGGSGNADLYVQRTTAPTPVSSMCAGTSSTTTESCTFITPSAGVYWILVRGATSYAGVTLYSQFTGSPTPYRVPGTATTIGDSAGSLRELRIFAPAERDVTVHIFGGTGDADLYVRPLAKPTLDSFTCRPYTAGNNETCVVSSHVSGDVHILVRGFTAYSGVTIVASY